MNVIHRISLLLCSLLLSACGAYHLGTPVPALEGKRIFIAPAQNESYIAQAQVSVTDNTVKAFLTDGTLTVSGEKDANLFLEIVLKDYDRETLAKRAEDTGLTRNVELRLVAEITLSDNNGNVLLDKVPVEASAQIFADSGLTQAENAAVSELSRELAERILTQVLGQW